MSAPGRPIGENEVVAQGKRAGARQKRGFSPVLLMLTLGVTASVVAWGYLVVAAIDFGGAAREGDTTAWWFLALSSLGAVACLFLGLILVSRIIRALGITRGPQPPGASTPNPPDSPDSPEPTPRDPDRPTGGHRAAR
ncbi:hypothetical protein BH09ACT12_BH09ACT12_28300 [soil metagenome]